MKIKKNRMFRVCIYLFIYNMQPFSVQFFKTIFRAMLLCHVMSCLIGKILFKIKNKKIILLLLTVLFPNV